MRRAILVANDHYADERLSGLSAPRHDVVALQQVLADPELGAFGQVELVYNETSAQVAQRLERFLLVESESSDVVLVYFSGHGVLDGADRLCFATSDTSLDQLRSTAVPATMLHQMLDEGPRQQLIILDCCYSGSFVAGQGPKGDQVHLSAQLGPDAQSGRGRTILTATNRFQFALEANADPSQSTSLYTGVLIDGMRSGAADGDSDGVITADELHDFAVDRLRAAGHQQMPHRWAIATSGRFAVARAGAELPAAASVAAPAASLSAGPGESPRWLQRRGAFVAIAVLVVLAGVVGMVVQLTGGDDGDADPPAATSELVGGEVTIDPDDGWEVVVAEAIRLRQLGRSADSVATFAVYGEMFAEEDPTAEQYSATAQQLTSEFDALGIIDGAVYVFALQELGEANGFEVGDVILAVGGVSTMDVSGFLAAVEFVADRETAEVDVLRLTPEGQFSEVEIDARVVDGTLGVGAMPI